MMIPFNHSSNQSVMTGLDSRGFEIYLNQASIYPELDLVNNLVITVFDARPAQMTPDGFTSDTVIYTVSTSKKSEIHHVRIPKSEMFDLITSLFVFKRLMNDDVDEQFQFFLKVKNKKQFEIVECGHFSEAEFERAATLDYDSFVFEFISKKDL